MNVKKRIMPIFVAVLMVFTMMPMMAGSVYADTEIVVDGLAYRIGPTEDAELIGIDDENGKAINKMTGEITIPGFIHDHRVKIGPLALSKLPSEIHIVIIEEGVMEIMDHAFSNNKELTSVSFPSTLRRIGKEAFSNCFQLKSVSFAENCNLYFVDDEAFRDCFMLEAISFGNITTSFSIECRVFEGCASLKEVTIPSTVRFIGKGSFANCNILITVYYGGTMSQWKGIRGDGKDSINYVWFDYPISQEIKTKGTSIKDLKSAKKAVTVKWKKQPAKINGSHITGYQIRLATNKKFTKNKKTVTVKGYKNVSKKIKNLKSKKRYYVKIRTYKSVGGDKCYSPWSKARSIKTR